MNDCMECRWALPSVSDDPDEGVVLKCRRYPPQLLVLNGELAQASPDAVTRCGEFTA